MVTVQFLDNGRIVDVEIDERTYRTFESMLKGDPKTSLIVNQGIMLHVLGKLLEKEEREASDE